MPREITIRVHSITDDGLPDMTDEGPDGLTGRVAFIFDGCIVSGWPLLVRDATGHVWEANTDVGHNQPLGGVTHWVEFAEPVWDLERAATQVAS